MELLLLHLPSQLPALCLIGDLTGHSRIHQMKMNGTGRIHAIPSPSWSSRRHSFFSIRLYSLYSLYSSCLPFPLSFSNHDTNRSTYRLSSRRYFVLYNLSLKMAITYVSLRYDKRALKREPLFQAVCPLLFL